ncbi:hypothetical protein C2S53_014490 [Perilla frutescens var. hirtella]|uniref:Pentatricopeptide repeat-containing protein n=1 Tax=Perilla frutescens var. hirtella TaxID=608512 RepID=A0AAD4IUY6_PERFH|nr:hypothetical protein C2S53_014490 [Perilla frutescens var. hirtella]
MSESDFDPDTITFGPISEIDIKCARAGSWNWRRRSTCRCCASASAIISSGNFFSHPTTVSHHLTQSASTKVKEWILRHSANVLVGEFLFAPTSELFRDPSFADRLLKLSSNLIKDFCYTLLIFKRVEFPDAFRVNTVIKKYFCSSNHAEAVIFYVKMLRGCGFYPNGFTFPPLISACAKLGCLSLGQMCHGHTVKDLVSWNTIVDGFAKVGEMGLAHRLFDEMLEKNVISWNVVITGYLNFQNPGNALKLFQKMIGQSFDSIDTTMVQVITACGRRKNSVSWNAMILGHCIHGNPAEGLNLYEEMKERIRRNDNLGIEIGSDFKLSEGKWILPDELTFIGVLCACSHLGLLEDGRNHFSQMTDVFCIKLNFGHYWCLANLMANVGLM